MGLEGLKNSRNWEINDLLPWKLEMQTLRLHLAPKQLDFAARNPTDLIVIDPQIFWLSQNFGFLASFHGDSKNVIPRCASLKAVTYLMNEENKKYLSTLFLTK